MGYVSFFISFVLFFLAAFATSFGTKGLADNLGELTAWGFVFLALGHFLSGGVTFVRERVGR